jgi:hypothetical protein
MGLNVHPSTGGACGESLDITILGSSRDRMENYPSRTGRVVNNHSEATRC